MLTIIHLDIYLYTSGVDFTVYSLLKDYYVYKGEGECLSTMTLLFCGAFSSSCGQIVSYPLQLARTKLQAQGMPGMPVRYSGVSDCIKQTFSKEGWTGLLRMLQ